MTILEGTENYNDQQKPWRGRELVMYIRSISDQLETAIAGVLWTSFFEIYNWYWTQNK